VVIVGPTKAVDRGWIVARHAVDSTESRWRAELGDRRSTQWSRRLAV
jgi:hypothetical protein